jgi:hypothetical protein
MSIIGSLDNTECPTAEDSGRGGETSAEMNDADTDMSADSESGKAKLEAFADE